MRFTAEDIKKYMTQHECGMYEAKDELMRQWVKKELTDINAQAKVNGSNSQLRVLIERLTALLLATLSFLE